MRHLDLRQIRYFLTVAEELNFRKAADRLHITQPPLSRQIQLLEEALGARLFERDTHHVSITAVGRIAAREFTAALERWDLALAAIEKHVEAESLGAASTLNELSLGLPWWGNVAALPKAFEALQRNKLVSRYSYLITNGPACVEEIRRGRMDAALVVLPLPCDGLTVTPVGAMRMMAAVPASSAQAEKRRVSLADLAQLPAFFMFRRKDNPKMYDHLRQRYDALHFKPQKVVESSDPIATYAQIAAGQGASILPENVAAQPYAGVAIRPLAANSRVELPIAFISRPNLESLILAHLIKVAPQLLLRTESDQP